MNCSMLWTVRNLIGITIGLCASAAAAEDLTKTVLIGHSQSYVLGGTADHEAVRKHLEPLRYVPKNISGKVPVSIQVTVNTDVVGCGCPRDFNDFSVYYEIESTAEGTKHVVTDFMITNHAQRRTSMMTKFGTLMEIGDMHHNEGKGFSLVDEYGRLIVNAEVAEGMPQGLQNFQMDVGFHSMGGRIGLVDIPQVFYRAAGPLQVAQRPFDPARDRFEVAPFSPLANHLKKIQFVPMVWRNQILTNGKAWLP